MSQQASQFPEAQRRFKQRWIDVFCVHLKIKGGFEFSQECINPTVLNEATVALLPACLPCAWFSLRLRHFSPVACDSIDRWLVRRTADWIEIEEQRLSRVISNQYAQPLPPVSLCSPTVNGTWTGITWWSLCPLQSYYHWRSWNSWVSTNVIMHY